MTQVTFMAHNLRIKLWQLSSASSSLDNSKPPRRSDFADLVLWSFWSLLLLPFFPICPRPASTSPGEPIGSTGGSSGGGAGTTGTPFLMALLSCCSMKTWATASHQSTWRGDWAFCNKMFNMQMFVKKVPYNKWHAKTIKCKLQKKLSTSVNYAEPLIINEFQLVMWNYLPNSSITSKIRCSAVGVPHRVMKMAWNNGWYQTILMYIDYQIKNCRWMT